MSKKLLAVIAVVVVVVVVVLVLALRPAEVEPPIEIGGIFCLTGGLAAMGELISQGAILAVEEINAAGGVLGRELVLLIEDDATIAAAGFDAFKKLVEVDGVQVIIGPMISGGVMASGAYAQEMNVPLVSPSATSPLITLQPWTEWALRTCPSDAFQGAVLADIIIEEGYTAVAIIVQDTPYGIGIELVVTELLEAANVRIVESIRYDPRKVDFLAELGAIKAANPDVIVQVGYHTDSAIVYRQAGELGLDTIPWLVAEGVYGLEAETYPAAAAFMAKANLRGATLAPDPELPAFVAFKAAYEARWGVPPGVYSDTAYDAVMLIARAIERAGVYDGAAIKAALYEVGRNFSGASGTITWDENGDRVSATYGIWRLERDAVTGEFEYVILERITF
jgi:ABC-type branched-subunit amino acid transport system substrate-binding protein